MRESDLTKMLPPNLRVAFEFRLVSPQQVIGLADQIIAKCAHPPDWLIDLACTQAKFTNIQSWLRQLDLPEEADDTTFLGLVAVAFFREALPLENIASLLFDRFCLIEWQEMTDFRQQIYLLDDEMEWNKARAKKTCERILQQHLKNGQKLLETIGAAEKGF